MTSDHTSRINRAFEILKDALTPFVQDAMEAVYGAEWHRQAQEGLHDPYLSQKTWDVHALLLIMNNNWHAVFNKQLGEMGRTLVGELRAQRTRDTAPLNPTDAFRTLDTVARLLRAVGDEAGAQTVQQDALALMQLQFQQPPPPAPPPLPVETPAEAPPEAPSLAPKMENVAKHDEEAPPAQKPAETLQTAIMTEAPEHIDKTEDAEHAREASEQEEAQGAEATEDAQEADGEEASEASEEEEEHDEEEQDEALRESVTAGVKSWFGRLFHKADEQELEPLELRIRLLDKIEHALRRFRSERPLSITQINLHILAPASGDRFTYDAALNDLDPPFEQAVLNRLNESGFDLPEVLNVKPQLHTRAPKKLEAEFEEAGPIVVELRKQATRTSATITVVKGKAAQKTYRFHSKSTERINLGRLQHVEDDRYGHIIRRNDIAFVDHTDPALTDEERAINETVSRRHAHIEYNPQAGLFVLFNDQGVTSISRPGLPHPVRVSHQTAPLQDGDMIFLGRACLRFETRRRG